MTPEQITKAKLLYQCTYLPGSFEKRFARDMFAVADLNPSKELTPKQSEWLDKQFFRYRNQISPGTDKRVKNLLKSVPKNPNQKSVF